MGTAPLTLRETLIMGCRGIRPVEVSAFGHFPARRESMGKRGEGKVAAQAAGALLDAAATRTLLPEVPKS